MDIEEFIDMTLTKIIGGVQSVQITFPQLMEQRMRLFAQLGYQTVAQMLV